MSTRSISGCSKIRVKCKYTEGGVECEEGFLKAAAYPGSNVVQCNDFERQGTQTYQLGSTDYAGTGTDTTTTKNPMWLLVEDVYQGKTVADQLATGDNVQIHMCSPGEIVQVLVASGQTVVKGSGLSANTSGLFVVDATNAACIALEPSGGSLASDKLVRVRVL